MSTNLQNSKELYQGVFPTKYEELLSLPGIGEYTAAAISSFFSTNEPHAAIDGNVYRILARVFGIMEEISTSSSKTFKPFAYELLDKK